jgi:toxin co-regulated pilus biosynthesis protein E
MKLTYMQRMAISADHRKEWYRALGKIAHDGLPIFEALERMSVEFAKTKHPLTPMVKLVLLRLRGAGISRPGQNRRTLGSELIGMVPDDEAMMIQAGDMSGRIAAGLHNAAGLVETKGALKSSIIGSLLKPVGYLLALNGLLLFMSAKLLPSFEKSKPRATWPARAQMLGSISDHSILIAGSVVSLMVLTGAALSWLVPNWTGELRDRCDRSVFPFTLIASISGASFLTTLSGYISAGTPFVEAVKNVSSTATPYMQSQCGKLLDMMKRGRRPEDALCQLAIIPPRYHWIISVYAMSGDTAKAYETIAEEMVFGVQKFVQRLFGYVISNLLLVVIGFMAFWIYGSMFDIALSNNGRP